VSTLFRLDSFSQVKKKNLTSSNDYDDQISLKFKTRMAACTQMMESIFVKVAQKVTCKLHKTLK